MSAATAGRTRMPGWIGVAIVIAVVGLAVAALTAFGLRMLVITTASMGTTAPVGSLVVAQPQSEYHVGEVISFRAEERVVTHRIVAADEAGFTTKGDVNAAPDAWHVAPDAVIGAAAWIAPGLGRLLQAAPWLVLGIALTETLARLTGRGPGRHVIRLVGCALTVAIVSLWLRPWVGVALLSVQPAGDRGVLMHVVNTGLFPVRAGSVSLRSGQDALVHVIDRLPSGAYGLAPVPDLSWAWRLGILVVCLVPLIIALLLPSPAVSVPAAAADGATATDATAVAHPVAKGIIVLAVTILAVMLVAVVNTIWSTAAFSAVITDSANTAGTRPYFTCKAAATSVAAPGTYAAYAMGTSGPSTEQDLTTNNRDGTWARSRSVVNSYGCTRDTPLASVTFNGTNQCLYVPGRLTNPSTFSLEAWFRTNKKSNGKIIGFGDANGSAADGSYDRHIYLDSSGRVVFGVYPGSVRTISTTSNNADDRWHHVVATLSPAAGMALYLDGQLAASNPAVTTAQSYAGYWKIGCGNLTSWANGTVTSGNNTGYNGPSYFDGWLQYAAVYTVALTPAQVKAHDLAGVP
ncbi:signal peptidase I [Microbacterium luticocti]|uniref:signal peptidase I n=1 Tax=Microbacterium luticocti TaxID=451764 RepID=UPI0012EC3C72|nr:signal peptidase I [Microbacterium luticocti]